MRRLGEGGMGVVYLAQQERPIRRSVAIKIIRLGMSTQEIVARFEAERQTLAQMEHPGIARVFEAGSTEDGRPYFVMEHVDGLPITDYCDRRRCTTGRRVELFAAVCDAVHHAHLRGVIHRDLKPSNILIAEIDGRAQPKVIDFGVAKATARSVFEHSVYTELGQIVGTLDYMSPEQAQLTGFDVDLRSDVYSLGVLFYELLVGRQPFERRELRRSGLEEVLRVIREEESLRPSTRIATLGGEVSTLARNRGTNPQALARTLRGDLDWVVMRALEKDRERRYASASELAAEARRYLRHEPVLAGPPGGVVRLRKFVRRNRFVVAIAATLVMAAAIGVGGLATGLVRARTAEAEARAQAAAAEKLNEFLTGLFREARPERAQGKQVTVREIVDRGAAIIEDDLAGQPLLQARMMNTIANVYNGLAISDSSAALLERAEQILRETSPEHGSIYLADTLQFKAQMLVNRGRYDQAQPLFEEALGIRREQLGPDHRAVASALSDLAKLHGSLGHLDRAVLLAVQAVEIWEQVLGPNHRETVGGYYELGLLHYRQGRYDQAESMMRQVKEHYRDKGEDNPRTAQVQTTLGAILQMQKRYEDARPLYETALATLERVYGRDHAVPAGVLQNLAGVQHMMGDLEGALASYSRVLQVWEKTKGLEHPHMGLLLTNLGTLYTEMQRFGDAQSCLTRALEIGSRQSDDHPLVAESLSNLGSLRLAQGRPEEAQQLLRRALALHEARLEPGHPTLISTRKELAASMEAGGDRFEQLE